MARRPKDPEKRIEALEKILGEDPNSPAFFPLAALLLERGEEERAASLLKSGLAAQPVYAAARVLRGRVLFSQGKAEEASQELEAAVRQSPWNLAGQRLLADCRRSLGDE
ncbi:MAG: hypothetical protein V3V62_14155, partial [bacterium]